MLNKENSYKLKQEVFLDQCCLHLAKWSIEHEGHLQLIQSNCRIRIICGTNISLFDWNIPKPEVPPMI